VRWAKDYGAGGGTRTHDSRLKRSVLYRLSYTRETKNVARYKLIALHLSYVFNTRLVYTERQAPDVSRACFIF
jgi:hypothetical protein